jgi:hypothetical protein
LFVEISDSRCESFFFFYESLLKVHRYISG